MTHTTFHPTRSPMAMHGARKSAVHRIALGLVWVAVASGAVVFSEPAPVDLLTIILIGLLPLLGLVSIRPALIAFFGLWMLAGAAALLASIAATDLPRATIHSFISLYLYAAAFVFATFVARNPEAHTRLVLGAYLWAATLGALAGVIGNFGLVPGAEALFTRFSRAAGTFKDPNVFGAFLVPAAVYALHLTVSRPVMRAILPAGMMLFLFFAILLSFSRGAWINLAIAVAVYGYFSFVMAPTNWQRLKMISIATAGVLAITFSLMIAMQIDQIGRLLEQRASASQSYDEGPEGRFGGQAKAKRLIADNPMGIGALEFSDLHHHEDVHNVYLSMFLNAGWIGGFIYLLMVGVTSVYGLNHALKRTLTQPLFLVVYGAFIGHVVEGVVIDTDHWRHFYLLMGIIWGLMVADNRRVDEAKGYVPRRAARQMLRRGVRRNLPVRAPEPERIVRQARDLRPIRAIHAAAGVQVTRALPPIRSRRPARLMITALNVRAPRPARVLRPVVQRSAMRQQMKVQRPIRRLRPVRRERRAARRIVRRA